VAGAADLAVLVGQGILKAFAKDDSNRQAFAKLVRTLRRTGGPDASHLSEVPVIWRMKQGASSVSLVVHEPCNNKRRRESMS
jgi:hypothetical protein